MLMSCLIHCSTQQTRRHAGYRQRHTHQWQNSVSNGRPCNTSIIVWTHTSSMMTAYQLPGSSKRCTFMRRDDAFPPPAETLFLETAQSLVRTFHPSERWFRCKCTYIVHDAGLARMPRQQEASEPPACMHNYLRLDMHSPTEAVRPDVVDGSHAARGCGKRVCCEASRLV